MSNQCKYIEERSDFYVYMYRDPLTNQPFYVGKGLNNRAEAHLKDAKNPDNNSRNYYNTIKLNKIRKILNRGEEPVVEYLCENMTEQDAFEFEIFLINQIGRLVLNEGPLTNLTEGGEGTLGPKDFSLYHLVNTNTQEQRTLTRRQIIQELEMTESNVSMLLSEDIVVSNGWVLEKNLNEHLVKINQDYTFVDESGNEEVCTLNELCNKYGLRKSGIHALINRSYHQSQGWSIDFGPICTDRVWSLTHISGEEKEFGVNNLHECGDEERFFSLLRGDISNLNGWIYNRDLLNKVHYFINGITNEVFIGTQGELVSHFGTNPTSVCAIVQGRKPHANYWFINAVPEKYRKPIDEKFTQRWFVHSEHGCKFTTSVNLARDYNITIGKLNEVMRGTRRHASGWFLGKTVPEDIKGHKVNGGDPRQYVFFNIDSESVFNGTRVEFAAYSGIHQKKVYNIVKNGHIIDGWKAS